MSQVHDSTSGNAAGPGGREHFKNGELARRLAVKLESRGLDTQLVTYPADADDDEHVEEIIVTNPAARERGEARVGDDGSVTWEYFERLDDAGVASIVDELTNVLGATGLRQVRDTRP